MGTGASMIYMAGFGGITRKTLIKNGIDYDIENITSNCCHESLNINDEDIYCSVCNKLHDITEYYPDAIKIANNSDYYYKSNDMIWGISGSNVITTSTSDTIPKKDKFVSYEDKKKHWLKSFISWISSDTKKDF